MFRKLQILIALIILSISCQKENPILEESIEDVEILYSMAEESDIHEGTWLQWPHQYQYGYAYRNSLDATWIEMTRQLASSEKVHIIAYDKKEKSRITGMLNAANVDITNIDFSEFKTDDVWVRDNGPIYVHDQAGNLKILDFGFNGWGKKAASRKCDDIPSQIGELQKIEVVNLNSTLVNEGGSFEIDGNGTLMACKSSILNDNRNPGLSLEKIEIVFKKYLGVTNFIWLDGQAGLEITDQHIDGFARFGNSSTIVTMEEDDLLYYDVKQSDIDLLYAATNVSNTNYTFLKIPLTQNDVVTSFGINLGYKGSYINYYIANTKVLVPTYNDPNDELAIALIQTLYPDRTVVGIDVRNLYENGGMIHCVTQQQPY